MSFALLGLTEPLVRAVLGDWRDRASAVPLDQHIENTVKTLRAVVDFYVGGGSSNPHLDKQIKPLALTGRDREDLVAFLESLTGELARVKE